MRVNALLVRHKDGYKWVEDSAAIAADRRIEGFVNYPDDTVDEATRKAEATLADLKEPRWQIDVGIEPRGTGDVPLVDWQVGDTIIVPNQDATPTEVRVIELTRSEDEAGNPIYLPKVGDRVQSMADRASVINRTMNAGTLGGRDPQAMPRLAARAQRVESTSPPLETGCAEAFGVRVQTTTPQTVASEAAQLVTWWYEYGTRVRFATTGVDVETDPTGIGVPAGLWMIVCNLQLVPVTPPSSGHVAIRTSYLDGWGYTPYQDFLADTEDEVTTQLTELNWFEDDDTIEIEVSNQLDVDVVVGYGRLQGHQVNACEMTESSFGAE